MAGGCSLIKDLSACAANGEAGALAPFSCQGLLGCVTAGLKEPLFVLDKSGVLLHANPAFAELFAAEPDELYGLTLDELLVRNPLQVQVLADEALTLEASSSSPHGRRWEIVISCAPGEVREVVVVTSPLVAGGGGVEAYLGAVSDVTAVRSSQRLVEQLTYIDPLTGLSNQRRFEERLEHALLLPDIAERGLAVVWLSVDRVALVRDSHGEAAAQKLILHAAELLAGCVRDRDLIAHVGGGHFALMLLAEKDHRELTTAVERIVRMVSRPVEIAHNELQIGLHVGAAVFPQDGVLSAELIDNAQTALNQAHLKAGSSFCFYSRDMNLRAAERLELEARLRGALLRKELLLHYQPQVDLDSGAVVALEALLRWHSPDYGWVGPQRFIPVAESCGMIQPIGNWVIKTALAQLRRWLDSGMAPLRMAINVSASQLLHPNFVDIVGRSLQEHAIPSELLELELTESTIMRYTEGALKVFRALKKMGVHLAIDDFGTGYSSLAYLKNFPVDRLKIDRSFLKGMALDSKDAAIVDAMIGLGHGLGLEVVAEGVEEEDQYRFLVGRHCDIGQGFLWSQPQPSEHFPSCIDHLKSQQPRISFPSLGM